MKYVQVAEWSFETYFEGKQKIQCDPNAPQYIVNYWLNTYSRWHGGNINSASLEKKLMTLKANKVRMVNVYE